MSLKFEALVRILLLVWRKEQVTALILHRHNGTQSLGLKCTAERRPKAHLHFLKGLLHQVLFQDIHPRARLATDTQTLRRHKPHKDRGVVGVTMYGFL